MDEDRHSLSGRLNELIRERSLLRHPFYRMWSEGKLSIEMLQGYAGQYWHHTLAFPTYVSGVHSSCPVLEVRQEILENLIEEERGPDNHPELWLRFAESIGLPREQVENSEVLPETLNLGRTFRWVCRERPFWEGVAALYAYESQQPSISEAKIDGLKRFYDITDPSALEFFAVHMEADVEHAATEAAILDRFAQDEETRQGALRSAGEILDALWGLLDGVQREYVGSAA